MRDRARANPSIREIVDYWSARKDESDLAVDWSEAHERCWRCGYRSKLQKCHVIPGALGGPNTAENLVLLCGRCHHEAPNHQDPQYLWA
ncbi:MULTISPECIES: HNH endonuclease signature motif containing protein [Actinoalloteichus]|uniref:HNH endonuclease n=1 Tax=Actinoalloteichus caeruleus DSM 43889 TaxID=1120930 RepID=A0ABT1JHV6_ACTCY|nr:HNH endonuclease signature motif containing protein [Actinoalloteichus caeruleus]MCP2331784.1 HNH endonuclease [Actinoalloteichus caeruleus DSM 43889]